MASFSAELLVEGYGYPLTSCFFGVHQATGQRGRVSTKVRYEPIHLTLDVPHDDLLLAWAADPHKRVAAALIFRNADGGSAIETVQMTGAYCVSYAEGFRAGDAQNGAYQAFVTLTDPDGFTMQAGGAGTFAMPAPGAHGMPPVAAAASMLSPAGRSAKQKLVANTPAHKAARWAAYQAVHANDPKMWSQARWEKQYAANMRNPLIGLGREDDYRLALGGVSETVKTAFTNRQIDIYRPLEQYCGQLKTGKMSLTAQARIDLQKDADLINNFFQVEYILEKGASKPFLDALGRIGATYKIGPQLP